MNATRNMKNAVLLIAVFLLGACTTATSTNDASFVDPAFRDARFGSFVVQARTESLAEQQAIEYSVTDELRKAGLQAWPAFDLVPPTRVGKDPAADKRAFMNTGAAAIIEITPSVSEVDNYHRGHGGFNIGVGVGGRSRDGIFGGTYYPGNEYNYTRSRYNAEMSTLPKYQPVWKADFKDTTAGGVNDKAIANRMSRKLVNRLRADGLI